MFRCTCYFFLKLGHIFCLGDAKQTNKQSLSAMGSILGLLSILVFIEVDFVHSVRGRWGDHTEGFASKYKN